jgi:hypothetical protein
MSKTPNNVRQIDALGIGHVNQANRPPGLGTMLDLQRNGQ